MDYKEETKKLFDINEINRLHRAAKNKDKKEIIKWGQSFEYVVTNYYNDYYREKYLSQYMEKLKDIDTALLYVLHFGEATSFGNKRLKSTMDDLSATVKGFYSGEFNRDEYRQMLKDDGIKLEDFN